MNIKAELNYNMFDKWSDVLTLLFRRCCQTLNSLACMTCHIGPILLLKVKSYFPDLKQTTCRV